MQLPSTGDLLRGLREGLAMHVLPALPKGVAAQQLRAALHLIAQLERTWDLTARHLAEDNADITAVLSATLTDTGLESRLAAANVPAPTGYNDAALRAAAQRNLALHHVLAGQAHNPAIAALHRRMVARDARFVGDDSGEAQ